MDVISFPYSYDDVRALYRAHITPPSQDGDAFTSGDELKNGGMSFFMYGKKVFEFHPGIIPYFRLTGQYMQMLDPAGEYTEDGLYTFSADMTTPTMTDFVAHLQDLINTIFRNLVTEHFGCCNDFIKCSDARQCLYPHDRFYNGCSYRKNLEAGRIFYGRNKNI